MYTEQQAENEWALLFLLSSDEYMESRSHTFNPSISKSIWSEKRFEEKSLQFIQFFDFSKLN